MALPESLLILPEEKQIVYLDGIKGYKNQVIEVESILMLKRAGDFPGFVECITNMYRQTDYAGLHATDVNWFEYGCYQSCLLLPDLLEDFDILSRMSKKLDEDQSLKPICYFTEIPKGDGRFSTQIRADLMLNVEGGLYDHWGQYVMVYLVDGAKPFYLDKGPVVEEIKQRARLVGKPILTDEEALLETRERLKEDHEKDKEIKRLEEEEMARWLAEADGK